MYEPSNAMPSGEVPAGPLRTVPSLTVTLARRPLGCPVDEPAVTHTLAPSNATDCGAPGNPKDPTIVPSLGLTFSNAEVVVPASSRCSAQILLPSKAR